MRAISTRSGALMLLALLTIPASGPVLAQEQEPANPTIVVNAPQLVAGPEVKGTITARTADKIKVTAADGTVSIITITEDTKIKSGSGLFGGGKSKLTIAALLNGLPVTVKTMKPADGSEGLYASQVSFKGGDLKTANMIRSGTAQGFEEQTAATEALRGRMGDIDKYNIKSTTNVYFASGKWVISPQAKAELCTAANAAGATDNSFILVVGYTDSVGSDEYNQTLSEKRAAGVINYLQQVCKWKPYRMLTPTGMAESDPLADNETPEGRAQNRRVSVNVLVSKALDGM